MSTFYILIVFGILEFTIIVGGILISKSFERYFHELLPAYKEMVTLINEKDEAREKVYKSLIDIHKLTNEQYETMMKVFKNTNETCSRLIDYGKTLNAHYYTLEERYSQIYDQFDECHKQLNDIRKLVEPEIPNVTINLDTESLVQKKEDNDNNDVWG